MAKEVTPVHIDDVSFEDEVINSEKPVLVDFWAPWCGPCQKIGPIVEEIAGEYKDKIKVTKMNVDDAPSTAGRYNVRGIPTLILFKNGEIQDQIVGLAPKSRIEDLIKKYL